MPAVVSWTRTISVGIATVLCPASPTLKKVEQTANWYLSHVKSKRWHGNIKAQDCIFEPNSEKKRTYIQNWKSVFVNEGPKGCFGEQTSSPTLGIVMLRSAPFWPILNLDLTHQVFDDLPSSAAGEEDDCSEQKEGCRACSEVGYGLTTEDAFVPKGVRNKRQASRPDLNLRTDNRKRSCREQKFRSILVLSPTTTGEFTSSLASTLVWELSSQTVNSKWSF